MSPARFCKQLLRRLGLIVVRESHGAGKYLDQPPAGIFDFVLLEVFPSLRGLRFIQIGANDGVRADPIWFKVSQYAWTGLLVEPLATSFAELRKNYAGRPGLDFLNAAVDVSAGTRTLHFLRPGLAVPDWARGLATFDLARLQRTTGELGRTDEDIGHQEIRTVTWDAVLERFGAGPCDVLVVDAEGHDIPILRAAPLGRLRPKVIHFEHGCATLSDRLAFDGELIGLGYEIASDGADTIAWLKPREAA
jgi:FkbM family methyltransferase